MPKKLEIPKGERYGKLVVCHEMERQKGKRVFLCECDCGKTTQVRLESLRSGNTTTCGCPHGEYHGGRYTDLYRVWQGMKERCFYSNHINFKDYGGRGIELCPKWHSFTQFRNDMEAGYKQGLQLDRIDNNGPYSPGNCQWVTPSENQRNKRNNRLVTHAGETRCLVEWSEITGISYNTLLKRLNRGWSVESTLEI